MQKRDFKKKNLRGKGRVVRGPRPPRFQLPKDAKIEYKNLAMLQRYLTERGKILSRRVSGLTAKQQREMVTAIKWARHLALLPVGASKRR